MLRFLQKTNTTWSAILILGMLAFPFQARADFPRICNWINSGFAGINLYSNPIVSRWGKLYKANNPKNRFLFLRSDKPKPNPFQPEPGSLAAQDEQLLMMVQDAESWWLSIDVSKAKISTLFQNSKYQKSEWIEWIYNQNALLNDLHQQVLWRVQNLSPEKAKQLHSYFATQKRILQQSIARITDQSTWTEIEVVAGTIYSLGSGHLGEMKAFFLVSGEAVISTELGQIPFMKLKADQRFSNIRADHMPALIKTYPQIFIVPTLTVPQTAERLKFANFKNEFFKTVIARTALWNFVKYPVTVSDVKCTTRKQFLDNFFSLIEANPEAYAKYAEGTIPRSLIKPMELNKSQWANYFSDETNLQNYLSDIKRRILAKEADLFVIYPDGTARWIEAKNFVNPVRFKDSLNEFSKKGFSQVVVDIQILDLLGLRESARFEFASFSGQTDETQKLLENNRIRVW